MFGQIGNFRESRIGEILSPKIQWQTNVQLIWQSN